MGRTRRRGARSWRSSRHWTAEEARTALAEAERSGLRLSQFASEHGLNVHRLIRWKKQLSAPIAQPLAAFEEVPSGPLVKAPSIAVRERFEIELRNGRVVRVSESFDAEALRRLLCIVEEEPTC
jgi:transposase-like protein